MRTRALILFICCGGVLFDADTECLRAQGVELQSASPNRDKRNPSATPTPAAPSSISAPFDLPSLVREVRGGVVLIFVYDRKGKLRGTGTGFFLASDSIATNAHVIEGAITVRAKAEDGTVYEILQVYACDPALDVAILQTATSGGKILRLGSNDEVQVGEHIAVIGNPLGAFENTVSDGIISGLRKDAAGDWLQITAAVSPGSSGSPVINAAGGVVGIVARGITGNAQSLNFARPAKYLTSIPRRPASFPELAEQLQQRALSDADFKAGLEADSKGNRLLAIKHFNLALAKFPDNLVVLDVLGNCYVAAAVGRLSDDGVVNKTSEQQLREAVRLYRRILSFDPNNISALEALSGAYGFLKWPDEAIATCRRGLTLDDSNASLWLSMAFAFADKGDLGRAEDAAKHAVKLQPLDANAWGTLATIYHMQGDFRQEREARTREAAATSRSSPGPRNVPKRKSR